MGFPSSDTSNSAADGFRRPRAHAKPPMETSAKTPIGMPEGTPEGTPEEVIDSLIAQPRRQPMGAVLPPFENEAFMSQRHEVNPAIALNLLEDIQQKVTAWQEQLRQLAHAIHAITAQGPMVNGWLESSVASQLDSNHAEASLLRHGDTDALMQYVDALENRTQKSSPLNGPGTVSENLPPVGQHLANGNTHASGASAQYQLCALSEDGSVRSQPCPPEQMASVSTAIARYQKFKQLMAQKDALESKLQLTVNDLTVIRTRLQ